MPATVTPSWYLFTALALVSFISPVAVHMFMPALPAVRADFAASVGVTQLTISLVMFTMAFATILYGGLSDRFGRRPVLLSGLALYGTGSVLCWLAPDIWTLLAGRIFQGAGAGCGIVLSRAIARDVYGGDRVAQVMAYLTAAYVMGPMLAPPLGGAMVAGLGWRSLFAFATIWAVALIVMVLLLVPETAAPRREGRHGLVAGYGRLLRRPRFTALAIQPGLISGAFFAQATASAFLAIEVAGISAATFGVLFMVYPLGYIAGNFISGQVGSRATVDRMVLLGALTGLGCAAMLVIGLSLWPTSLVALFLPGLFIGVAQGLCLPYAQAGAMAVDPDYAGSASGAVVFSQMFFAALGQQLVGIFADGTWVPLGVVYTGACVLSFGFALLARRYRPRA